MGFVGFINGAYWREMVADIGFIIFDIKTQQAQDLRAFQANDCFGPQAALAQEEVTAFPEDLCARSAAAENFRLLKKRKNRF